MQHMEDVLDMPLKELIQIMQLRIVKESSYFGIKTLKSPVDFWVYQEIIFATRPDFIVEIGNYCGGSTLALAHMCDNLGHGKVIGLDLGHDKVPAVVKAHPRIALIDGDACESFPRVQTLVGAAGSVLVIEDSAHTFWNTVEVLETYCVLVKPGGYLIVEDSICHHGLDAGPTPGPYEAIEAFTVTNKDFEIDRSKESFLMTWNPKGYLKRVR